MEKKLIKTDGFPLLRFTRTTVQALHASSYSLISNWHSTKCLFLLHYDLCVCACVRVSMQQLPTDSYAVFSTVYEAVSWENPNVVFCVICSGFTPTMRALNNALQCYCQPLSTGDFRPVEAGFILYFIIFYYYLYLLLFIFYLFYLLSTPIHTNLLLFNSISKWQYQPEKHGLGSVTCS